MDCAALSVAQLRRITVPPRGQRLKLAERSGLPLEEKPARSCHLERQQRTGAAEVDQIQTVGPEARSNRQIERIRIGRTVASHRQIDVALRSQPPLDRRTEENKKLQLRHRCRKISETLTDQLRRKHRRHAATLSERSEGVKDAAPLCARSRGPE